MDITFYVSVISWLTFWLFSFLAIMKNAGKTLCGHISIWTMFFKFIDFEKDRESKQGRGRERGWGGIPGRFNTVSGRHRLKLKNREIITWAKTKSRTLNWLIPSDTPCMDKFLISLGYLSRNRIEWSFSSSVSHFEELPNLSKEDVPFVRSHQKYVRISVSH